MMNVANAICNITIIFDILEERESGEDEIFGRELMEINVNDEIYIIGGHDKS